MEAGKGKSCEEGKGGEHFIRYIKCSGQQWVKQFSCCNLLCLKHILRENNAEHETKQNKEKLFTKYKYPNPLNIS
jgi:hypothetical protein